MSSTDSLGPKLQETGQAQKKKRKKYTQIFIHFSFKSV